MKAIELANALLDMAYMFGDLDVQCPNIAGDLDFVNGVTHRIKSGDFVVAVDPDEYVEGGL